MPRSGAGRSRANCIDVACEEIGAGTPSVIGVSPQGGGRTVDEHERCNEVKLNQSSLYRLVF